MNTGMVIPFGAGREENLRASLASVEAMSVLPGVVVIVCDGPGAALYGPEWQRYAMTVVIVNTPRKHEPGLDQPRNIGARTVLACSTGFSHVWFLDSDILVARDCLAHYEAAMLADNTRRILVGPYEWLPAGTRLPVGEMHNDPRQPSFNSHGPSDVTRNDLSAGLACFGGNLVWPLEEFTLLGGFWNELHHGRCEDGELGLRAVACGVPIGFVKEARGWHLDHPVNGEEKMRRNARDVPMLNARHPWVEGEGLFVVEEDGKRFNVRCPCGWEGNTMEIWAHQETCEESR
jgi:hypothetical protein